VNVDPECRALLVAASQRLEVSDDIVRLDAQDKLPDTLPRTALGEIASTLAHSRKDAAHCCCDSATPEAGAVSAQPIALCRTKLSKIVAEDQSNECAPLGEILRDRISLIAFFYTRCMNPAKCSLTISRLASVARLASASPSAPKLNVLAISYDPDFDTPSRLRLFGFDRGFPFGENARLMRTISGWAVARRLFDLQVGYNDATVNAHTRELFVVSRELQASRIDCDRLAEPAPLLEEIAVK
jgi:protein SCO1/2